MVSLPFLIVNYYSMLNCLAEYFGKWKLSLNGDKSVIMHLCKNKTQNMYNCTWGDIHLDMTTEYKYLGIIIMIIDQKLNYEACVVRKVIE